MAQTNTPPLSLLHKKKKTSECDYYSKFVLWFLVIPLLALFTAIRSIYGGFKAFAFQPLHFEYSNMDRN